MGGNGNFSRYSLPFMLRKLKTRNCRAVGFWAVAMVRVMVRVMVWVMVMGDFQKW